MRLATTMSLSTSTTLLKMTPPLSCWQKDAPRRELRAQTNNFGLGEEGPHVFRLSDKKLIDGAPDHTPAESLGVTCSNCSALLDTIKVELHQMGVTQDDSMTAVGPSCNTVHQKIALVCKVSVPNSQQKSRNFAHVPPSDILFSIQSRMLCRTSIFPHQ